MASSRRRPMTLILGLSLALLSGLPTSWPASTAAARWPQAEARLNADSIGDCSGAAAGGVLGTVVVRRVAGNLVRVRIQVRNAEPSSTYQVNVSCQGSIGTFTTDAAGEATVWLPATGLWGLTSRTTIVLDLHLAAPPYLHPARTTAMELPLAS